MIVCKFGGSCTANIVAIKNTKKVTKNSLSRKICVFSAIGKENPKDDKITDLLISFADNSNQRDLIQKRIIEKFQKLSKETKTKFDIKTRLKREIDIFLKTNDKERFVSRGEEWTSIIMARYLKYKFISAEKVMFFKEGKFDFEKSQKRLETIMKKESKIVIPGFYGVEEKKIKLFSRGGGDVSGAIISIIANADIYENWTDVEGIYEVNPRILKTQTIKKLSYQDLEFMTTFDVGVIHHDCAKILKRTGIKLYVRSIFDLKSSKTIVKDDVKNSQPYICLDENEKNTTVFVCKDFKKFETIHLNKEEIFKEIKKIYDNLKRM